MCCWFSLKHNLLYPWQFTKGLQSHIFFQSKCDCFIVFLTLMKKKTSKPDFHIQTSELRHWFFFHILQFLLLHCSRQCHAVSHLFRIRKIAWVTTCPENHEYETTDSKILRTWFACKNLSVWHIIRGIWVYQKSNIKSYRTKLHIQESWT